MTTRRTFLAGLGAAGALAWSNLSLASLPGDKRLVVVILRGGLDGLAAVVPHGDPDYAAARGAMALHGPDAADGVADLDGFFGLHPALSAWIPLWERRELAAVQAVALPYRARSHFDAQNLLENGTTEPYGTADGWLGRALNGLGGVDALALSRQVPLVLRGSAGVSSFDPTRDGETSASFTDRVAALYRGDPLLAPALAAGLETEAMVADLEDSGGGRRRRQQTTAAARAAGELLAASDGPRVAVLESAGWDTHQGQGTTSGKLAGQLSGLATGLDALRRQLGSGWDDTAIVVVSEFGRTVRGNGTNGTDHGTAGAVLLLGGAVAGGRVHTDWPGLSERHQLDGRDLQPTIDVRSVFKGVLRDHLGVSERDLDDTVFPDSRAAAPLEGLIA